MIDYDHLLLLYAYIYTLFCSFTFKNSLHFISLFFSSSLFLCLEVKILG